MKGLKILLLLLFLILSGCGEKKDFLLKATPSKAPAKLAILPINNLTNDVAGSLIYRDMLYRHFSENPNGYLIQSKEKTDELLNEAGITDGGQLKFVKPIELAEILGVDGLLMVDLNELGFYTYPYYHTRSVKATFYIYNFEKLIYVKPIRMSIKYFGISSAINTIDGAISGDEDLMNKGITQAGVDIAIHQGIKFATIAGFDHELAPEMALVTQRFQEVMPMGSINDRNYVKESEKEIKYLKEQISQKKSIVTDEMYEEEREEIPVLEEIIPILN